MLSAIVPIKTAYIRVENSAQTTLRQSHVSVCTSRGCIFSHVRPFYERAVSDLDP